LQALGYGLRIELLGDAAAYSYATTHSPLAMASSVTLP
jgi:hypothetical protein